LWGCFFKLGCLSLGGPAAHIAVKEHETVTKRGWLRRKHPLDMLAAANLVPGPSATETASHIGYVYAGRSGLVAGGVAFIVPATLISLSLVVAYQVLWYLPSPSSCPNS